MLKYQGTYRVQYETDKAGKPQEFTFIPCGIKRGTNICRHSDNMLNVYIPSRRIIDRLLLDYPDIFKPYQVADTEGTIIFSESLIGKAAVILKARTKGKDLTPRPRHIVISDEQKKILSDRMRRLNSCKDYRGKPEKSKGKNALERKVI